MTAVTLTYPLDTIRARLAFQVTGEHRYRGIIHTATSILKEEGGVRALYRGFLPTLMGMAPYAGLSFYCFEMIKHACMKYAPNFTCNTLERNTGDIYICQFLYQLLTHGHYSSFLGGLVLIVPAKLLCGGLAGAVAQTFSYPLDVTRRRMQLAMMDPATARFG